MNLKELKNKNNSNFFNKNKRTIAEIAVILALGGVLIGMYSSYTSTINQLNNTIKEKDAQIADDNKKSKELSSIHENKTELIDKIYKYKYLTEKEKLDFNNRVINAKSLLALEEIESDADSANKKNETAQLSNEQKEKEKAEENNKITEEKTNEKQPQNNNKEVVKEDKKKSKIVAPEKVSNEAYVWAKDFSFTYIGDSLGVGAEPYLQRYFPNSNFNNLSSRFLFNDWTPELNGYATLLKMKNDDQIQENVVIALGTNGGFSEAELNTYINTLPKTVKNIVLVNTRSQVDYNQSVSNIMTKVANEKDNVYLIDWYHGADKWNWNSIVASDRIHMKNYEPYAQFQLQAIYEIFK